MKKIVAITICGWLLSGCTSATIGDLPQTIQSFLEQQSTMPSALGANHTKDYYKYYLPADMGIRESTQLGEVFIKNDSMILMNFDPSAIIIRTYYTGEEEQKKQQEEMQQAREDGKTDLPKENETTEPLPEEDTETAATSILKESDLELVEMNTQEDVFTYKGTYLSAQQELYPYSLTLMSMGSDDLLYLNGSVVQFYCITPRADIQSNIKTIFLMMKSINYDAEVVLNQFSLKNATSSKQQSIDTLQQNLPSAGSIPDLLDQMEQLDGNR